MSFFHYIICPLSHIPVGGNALNQTQERRERTMLRKIGILVCIFVFLFTVGVLAQAPKKGGTLVFGRGGDSVGLDPAYETDGNSFMICDNVHEALVFYKDASQALDQ